MDNKKQMNERKKNWANANRSQQKWGREKAQKHDQRKHQQRESKQQYYTKQAVDWNFTLWLHVKFDYGRNMVERADAANMHGRIWAELGECNWVTGIEQRIVSIGPVMQVRMQENGAACK